MPSISIIMSVFNTESYLEKSIQSVLNQTFSDYEFIVINNGSTDGSASIISKYQNLDSRIVVIENKKNKSLACARNQALDIAKGKYIYVIDSDDYLETEALESIYKLADTKNVDLVVFGWVMEYYQDDKFLSYPVMPINAEYLSASSFRENAYRYLNQSILSVPWNKLYRNEIIKKYNIRYKETKLEDHHFNMDFIMNISSAIFIDKPFYHYFRSRPESELEFVYKFDLFTKKKEHYLHTKNVFDNWNLKNKKAWNVLYTYFAERIVQSIQELYGNNRLSKKDKKDKIKAILNDPEARVAIAKAHPKGLLMHFMVLPLKTRSCSLCLAEAKFINSFKKRHPSFFVKLKSEHVNIAKEHK